MNTRKQKQQANTVIIIYEREREIDRQTDERERGDEVFFFLISHSTDYLY